MRERCTALRGVANPRHYHSGDLIFFFTQKLWTVADQKPLVKKNMDTTRKIRRWSALFPKIKKRKKPSGFYQNHLPHFLRTLGKFRRQMCPVTSGRVDNCVGLRVGQRPRACVTIIITVYMGVANARRCRWSSFPRWVISSHFRLILFREIMVLGPSSFFFQTGKSFLSL